MVGIRSMFSRVVKLEQARAPVLSPIAIAFGSFDNFTAWVDEQMAAGVLDPRDFPIVVHCLRRYEADGTWGQQFSPAGAWRPGL